MVEVILPQQLLDVGGLDIPENIVLSESETVDRARFIHLLLIRHGDRWPELALPTRQQIVAEEIERLIHIQASRASGESWPEMPPSDRDKAIAEVRNLAIPSDEKRET